jgi:autotransporter-associated beta strand protein
MKTKKQNPFLIAIALGLVATTSTTHAADGTWSVDANGLWSGAGNWSASTIADGAGFIANFTNNITADRTVSLDTDRTINRVNFSDATTGTAGSWILNNNATATNNLILSGTTGAATGTVPVIDVGALGTGKTATISAIIEGSYGFTKTGTGTLVLSGANSNLSGNVNILSGTVDSKTSQTTLGSGTLVIGGTGGVNPVFQTGVNNTNSVQVNANTTGTSIIAANGTGSGFTMSGPITLNSANLNVRTFSAGTTASVTLSGGVTGTGNLLINNLSNGTAAAGKVTLSGSTINNIGTVTSQGTGPTANVISAVIGANVTGVIQNSATTGLNLTAVNLYTGNTTISAGTLQISSAGQLGSGSYAGTISIATGSLLQYSSSAAQTFSGNITGLGALTKDTSGSTLTLSGANTFNGGVTIKNGTLESKTTTTTLGTGTVTMGGTGSTGATYLTGQNNSNAFVINAPDGGTVAIGANGAGSAFTLSGGITLNGNLTLQTFNNVISGSIHAQSGFTGGITGTGNVVLNNNGLAANTIAMSTSAINHTGSLTLQGAATGDTTISANIGSNVTGVTQNSATSRLVLSGTNTYTGATNVNAGVLAVNGSLANTTTTVGNGGTLQGSGSIGGSVTVQGGGTVASGNSIQSLATGALTLEALATFAYEIDNDAPANEAADLTAVTGNLTIDLGNTAILTLGELGSSSWTIGEKLTLISYSGTWNGGLFNYGGTLADDSTINFSGMGWLFNYNDTVAGTNYTGDLTGSRYVTMTAIPEPSVTTLLGGLGILALLRRRRK